MGARGPQKKLASLERLEGNPSKRPIIEPTVIAEGQVFIPPHLHDDAQSCIEVIKASMPAGVYAKVDSFALAAFATAWANHKRAAHIMSAPEFVHVTVDEKGVERPSPWYRVLNSQSAEMRSWGDRLGLTPTARANLKLPGQGQPKSKFSGLVEQTGSLGSLNS